MGAYQLIRKDIKDLKSFVKIKNEAIFDEDAFDKSLDSIIDKCDNMLKEDAAWEKKYKELNLIMQQGINVHLYLVEEPFPVGVASHRAATAEQIKGDTLKSASFQLSIDKGSGLIRGNDLSKILDYAIYKAIEEKIFLIDGLKRIATILGNQNVKVEDGKVFYKHTEWVEEDSPKGKATTDYLKSVNAKLKTNR